jgi:hypothetical protein
MRILRIVRCFPKTHATMISLSIVLAPHQPNRYDTPTHRSIQEESPGNDSNRFWII